MTHKKSSFILDISRLLLRAGQAVPTCFDRVELAYAEHLFKYYPGKTTFVALSLNGRMKVVPHKMAKFFIENLLDKWRDGNNTKKALQCSYKIKIYLPLMGKNVPKQKEKSFYLLLSHHHLTRKKMIRDFIQSKKMNFIPMLHDIIPIEYPEYSIPKEMKRHQHRMKTIISLADGIIVPTNDVKNSIQKHFPVFYEDRIPIWPVQHGIVEHTSPSSQENERQPYFVYLSTIEPRKNHLMLLHLWRRMVNERGEENTPSLLLIGKRGWENENILDMLERCPALKRVVTEDNQSSDHEVRALIKNANGLLFPSFAEGYGLPLAEAMSLSTPCICSDILALREVGRDIPLYIDPLDTQAWQKAIDDFSRCGHLWQDQKKKLTKWKPYTWPESIEHALSFLK